MKNTLLVIDMQNDFIDGTLGTKEAQAIVPAVRAKIAERLSQGWEVIYTRDTHGEDYLSTAEGKKLPVVHCIKDTHGWQIADGLYVEGCKIIDKPTFGYLQWSNCEFQRIELIGLCTDICVVSNALILKAQFPDAAISVDSACCAGVSVESHRAALKTMQMCQIDII
ncbi:MAG: cysteine hydrolase [Ruminococcaceae bacterium]|nr:cysteine hydrolase [Oscillospiraceae bacterium]